MGLGRTVVPVDTVIVTVVVEVVAVTVVKEVDVEMRVVKEVSATVCVVVTVVYTVLAGSVVVEGLIPRHLHAVVKADGVLQTLQAKSGTFDGELDLGHVGGLGYVRRNFWATGVARSVEVAVNVVTVVVVVAGSGVTVTSTGVVVNWVVALALVTVTVEATVAVLVLHSNMRLRPEKAFKDGINLHGTRRHSGL